ncbi:MAG: extracellular solute-binding protein [Nitrososphaeria archaeon]
MSQEPKKVDRRNFIYAGLGAVALVAIGAAAYIAMNPPVVTVTQSTTVPTTSVVTTTVPTTSVITSTIPTTTTVTTITTSTPISGKISWWVGSWSEEAAKLLVSNFKSVYPNVDVEVVGLPWTGMYDKMLSALQSETPPDVLDVAVAWNIPFASLDLLLPLDQYSKSLDLSDFYESALSTAIFKGRLYGVPFRTETGGLLLNKGILKVSGLDPEKPPKNWDQLYEYCKATTVPGKTYGASFGFGEKMHAVYEYLIFLWGNGGEILDESNKTAVFNSSFGVEALEFLVKLYKEGLIPKDAVSKNRDTMFDEYFLQERAAMHHGAVYSVTYVRDKNPNLYNNLLIAPACKQKEVKQYVQIGGWNRVIAKKTKNPEAAWKLIEFLSSPQNQAFYTHTFPGRKSALAYPNFYKIDFSDPYIKAFSGVLDTGKLTPPIAQWGSVVDELATAIVSALVGDKTPKQALDEAANRVNQLLE